MQLTKVDGCLVGVVFRVINERNGTWFAHPELEAIAAIAAIRPELLAIVPLGHLNGLVLRVVRLGRATNVEQGIVPLDDPALAREVQCLAPAASGSLGGGGGGSCDACVILRFLAPLHFVGPGLARLHSCRVGLGLLGRLHSCRALGTRVGTRVSRL